MSTAKEMLQLAIVEALKSADVATLAFVHDAVASGSRAPRTLTLDPAGATNPIRQRIVDAVYANPVGLGLADLSRLARVPKESAQYHLRVAAEAKDIIMVGERRMAKYIPNPRRQQPKDGV